MLTLIFSSNPLRNLTFTDFNTSSYEQEFNLKPGTKREWNAALNAISSKSARW